MSGKKEPPLIEAIFEVRWGRISAGQSDVDVTQVDFDEEDSTLFAGTFKSKALADFPVYKKVNEVVPPNIPHLVKHQFWKGDGEWPCLQIGLGLMAANQTNDGYSWEDFKVTCLSALNLLDNAHHMGLNDLPRIGVELKYRDGFLLGEDETDNDFVKTHSRFDIPTDFFDTEIFKPSIAENHHISFSVSVDTPKATLITNLDKGQISGKPAFIQTTAVRARDALCPDFSIDSLDIWLEQAHAVQKHAYETLILPTHERT